jgi:hypothetical protein
MRVETSRRIGYQRSSIVVLPQPHGGIIHDNVAIQDTNEQTISAQNTSQAETLSDAVEAEIRSPIPARGKAYKRHPGSTRVLHSASGNVPRFPASASARPNLRSQNMFSGPRCARITTHSTRVCDRLREECRSEQIMLDAARSFCRDR